MPRRRGPGLVLGLTGGICSGKSAAAACFGRLGAGVVSLDEIARGLSRKRGPLYRSILRAFGRRYLLPGGELDRAALARAAFSKPALRRRLERATHPGILRAMRAALRRRRERVVVVEAPLLFEAGAERRFDVVASVWAPRRAALGRLMRRERLSRREALRRVAAQLPAREKAARADLVLRNDGSRARLAGEARRWWPALDLLARGGRR